MRLPNAISTWIKQGDRVGFAVGLNGLHDLADRPVVRFRRQRIRPRIGIVFRVRGAQRRTVAAVGWAASTKASTCRRRSSGSAASPWDPIHSTMSPPSGKSGNGTTDGAGAG